MKGKGNNRKGGVVVSLIIAAIVVTAVLVAVFVWPGLAGERPYAAVRLDTGDIYFGRLSYFPRLTMRDAYILQPVVSETDPNLTDLQVVPLSDAIWSPGKITLNYDKVVFIGRVGESSPLMEYIRRIEEEQQ